MAAPCFRAHANDKCYNDTWNILQNSGVLARHRNHLATPATPVQVFTAVGTGLAIATLHKSSGHLNPTVTAAAVVDSSSRSRCELIKVEDFSHAFQLCFKAKVLSLETCYC